MNIIPKFDQEVFTSGARVLDVERIALEELKKSLPADLPAVVTLILNTKGRVVICGIGKSGHIGRKIAATLASTGTPATFVHPAEASHGDLGMIMPQDVCILISNSGETSELRDVLVHTRRFSIPLIGISRRPNSTLMQAADYRLLLPDSPEACPIGMAPTTSTVLTLVMGDILAVVLMEQRGFRKEHFNTYHPGGTLGAQLLTVNQLMHSGDALPIISPERSLEDVLQLITAKGFGIAGLHLNGKLIGVITDGDLRRNWKNLWDLTPMQIASPNPIVIGEEKLVVDALALMEAKKINAIFALDAAANVVGVLRVHDCLRAGVI
ncbi:KpsF/GutQ family sugar-phosphate isomerase [Rhizobium pusense]|uniref:KpsF/GutQ family sugar-phosphate isomerase n=1 Tax=Agrobacterium pusense TaxID=648995 RepID=UPI0024479241|nr:KpsF/GutQ family sugar-phosphate isomerase [Agrobacterium pusense]MDH1270854.1 KpsF/GutQ family sugar-phosphate isomerase [Agrobacterium pusense]